MDNTSKNITDNDDSMRNFQKEYEELIALVERTGNFQWNQNSEWRNEGDNIKKFSLLKNSPTPILTNNIITEAE